MTWLGWFFFCLLLSLLFYTNGFILASEMWAFNTIVVAVLAYLTWRK